MTKKELDQIASVIEREIERRLSEAWRQDMAKKMADLERRVAELEGRPVYLPPVVIPYQPYVQPWTQPWTVTSADTFKVHPDSVLYYTADTTAPTALGNLHSN